MHSQGIRGPSYRFLHGSTKEIIKMKQQTSAIPMDLSHHIFPRIQPHLYSWTEFYGSNFLIWHGPQPEIVVTEPELIKEILNNREGKFVKRKRRAYFKNLFGDGLLVAEGEKWLMLRKLANHAFHGDCLKNMVPEMVACVQAMLERWRNCQGQEMEVCNEFQLLATEVISRTAFGSSYSEGIKILDKVSQLSVVISKNMHNIRFLALRVAVTFFHKHRRKFIRTHDDNEVEKIQQSLHHSIMEVVKRREDEVRSARTDSYGTDYLGSLLKAQHDSDPKNQMSADNIIDEFKTTYFAGQETTFSLLSWTVLLLSIHTDWQDKARREVHQLFGVENPNSEGLARLKIMNMILYETLRLYSPVTLITRRTSGRVKLGIYEFPENVSVVIPPLAVHHNPDIWGPGAHLFKPERFEEGLAKATNGNPTAFLGFGFGPRTCVGLNFAMNKAKIAISMILQRYHFTLSPGYVHSPFVVVTAQPQHGVQILLHSL